MITFGNFRSVRFRTDNPALLFVCTGKLRSKIAAVVQSLVASAVAFALIAGNDMAVTRKSALAGQLSVPESPISQYDVPRPWNFSVAKGPQGETSAAITHVADFDRSDPSLAGLMLRCASEGLDVIVITLLPFPPMTHPQVVLQNRTQTFNFKGSVIPTGAGILVPITGEELTHGAWQENPELTVRINDGDTAIQGVVTLSGLPEAANHLKRECSKK